MKNAILIVCLFLLACSIATAQSLPDNNNQLPQGGSRNQKKGVCLTTNKTKADKWKARVEALGASWHYSWGPSLPESEPKGVEFVPMIWAYHGANEKFLGCIRDLTVARTAKSRKSLLCLNEPDGKDQADMSVAQALEAWPFFMKTGRRLGSPGAVHADNEWMQEFMKQSALKKYRVDFICVHWYGGANAQALINHLTKIHDLYGKPIWITEFAVADWNAESIEKNKFSPQEILQFMKDVLPKLDALDFVERYAWFSAGETNKALGTSALFKQDGSLTALGKFYAAH